jgi:hypothetical protein
MANVACFQLKFCLKSKMHVSIQEMNLQAHFWWSFFKPRLTICMCDAEDVLEWLRIWHSTILLKFVSSVPLKKVGKLGNLSLNLRRESSCFWVADRLGLLEAVFTMFEDIDAGEQSVATTRQGFMKILAFCYKILKVKKRSLSHYISLFDVFKPFSGSCDSCLYC